MSEVPKSSVMTCMLPKIACVMQNAMNIDTKIENSEQTSGLRLLKIERIRMTMTNVDINPIQEVSLRAELDESWL